MAMKKVKVKAMKTTGGIYKNPALGFVQNVEYTLEDGTTKKSYLNDKRKKDIPQSIESREKNVANGEMTVEYLEDGTAFEVVRCSLFG